jgi:ferredoxin
MAKIAVDLGRCAGHGKCYVLAPDLLAPVDDWGHAEWIGGDVGADDVERRSRGARVIANCPEFALSWDEGAAAPEQQFKRGDEGR